MHMPMETHSTYVFQERPCSPLPSLWICPCVKQALAHLRNEFDFWNVHGIMNTSCLMQSGLHVYYARDLKYS